MIDPESGARGEGMHQAAWPTRAVPRLVASVPREAAAMRRVQAPSRACVIQESII